MYNSNRFCAKKYVGTKISKLKNILKYIACGTKVLRLSNLFAPKLCETKDEIEVLVWATIQIIPERKEPTKPVAASASTEYSFTLPTIAISVKVIRDSAIPEKIAGIAN